MKKLTQFLAAAMLVAGGSAFAATATQTVTTNVAGAVSISLTDGATTDSATLDTVLADTSAGNTATHTITLNVNSSDTTGFNVTASADDNGNSQGHMCEWDGTAYTTKCLLNAVSVTGTSAIPAGTSTGAANGSLGATPLKIFSSSATVSSGTIDAQVDQLIDWTDQVLAANQYRVVITYTIAAGV